MTELIQNPESQQPPVLTEQETQAVLAVHEVLAANQFDEQGNQVRDVAFTGVTSDGLFVAVETTLERNPLADKPGVTFLGSPMKVTGYRTKSAYVTELAAGGTLNEEVPEQGLKYRSTGPRLISSIGLVTYGNQIPNQPIDKHRMPELLLPGEENIKRTIYPIGPDGQPYDARQKAAQEAAEAAARAEAEMQARLAEVQPAQVAKRGIFGFLRRK